MKNFVNIVLITVIIALMGLAGYFMFVKSNETANWEIYRSEKYGIEFKHPSGWYVWDGGENVGVYIYERRVGPDLPGVSRLMQIYRHEDVSIDIKTYAEQNTPNYSDSGGFWTVLKEDHHSVFVDWTRSYQTYTKTIDGGPQECYEPPCDWSAYENVERLIVTTYIPHKSAIFSVSVEMGGEVSTDERKKKINSTEEIDYLNRYKQILSTVKFLN